MSSFPLSKVLGIYAISILIISVHKSMYSFWWERKQNIRGKTIFPRNRVHYTEIEIFKGDRLIAVELGGVYSQPVYIVYHSWLSLSTPHLFMNSGLLLSCILGSLSTGSCWLCSKTNERYIQRHSSEQVRRHCSRNTNFDILWGEFSIMCISSPSEYWINSESYLLP